MSILETKDLRKICGSGDTEVRALDGVDPSVENGYWFYRYHYTILPVLLMLPVFVLLGCAIPAVMYRQASKQSVVERLREAEG